MNLLQKGLAWVRQTLSIQETGAWPSEGGWSDSGELVGDESVLAISAAWACINLIAGTIATLPLMVYRTDASGRRSVAKDHPLYFVLHDSPNAEQTSVDFWEFGAAALELRGDCFAAIERGTGGRVAALRPVRPSIMGVTRRADGQIQYRWTDRGSTNVRLGAEMLHVRGFGGDPLGGLSTLAYGRQVFGLSQALDRSAASLFKNGIRPSGVYSTETKLLGDQVREIEGLLAEKHAGAMNAGRPMVLGFGLKWESLSLTPEDSQMLQSRGLSVEEVCRFFGVPPFMIGHTEKSTSWGTGLEQQTLGFVKFTLRRRLKRIEQALEKQLLTAQDRAASVTIEFNLEGLLRGDSGARSTFYQSALTNGWMTINEVRGLENLEPVEGGNTPRMQMQNVPITQAGAPVAAPAN